MPKLKKLKIPYQLLFLVGFLFIIIPGIFYANQTIQLVFFTPKFVPQVQSIASVPTFISIPTIHLRLPIEEMTIHNQTWGISISGASHLSTSARPTEKGAIILYAHNTIDRFGPIRWLKTGEKILLTTADGKEHVYTIVQTQEVNANQLDVLSKKNETLILYTCTGFADLKRFIIFASPQTFTQN